MFDPRLLAALSLSGLVALTACGQDAPKADPSAAPAASAAPKSPCPPEHQEVAEGGFCVKLPADWKAKPPEQATKSQKRFKWSHDKGEFIITVRADAEMPADIESQIMNKTGTITKGETAGGKGKWFLELRGEDGSTQVVVAGPKGLIECGMASYMKKHLEEQLERCKTIVPLP